MAHSYSVPAVTKPFPAFKWRWMEYLPVESFNRPDILLGVTRAIAKCEGLKASSSAFQAELRRVQEDLLPGGKPNLASKDPARNLIRRQGRYWQGLGLLASPARGVLKLTKLGQRWASGSLSNDEFVAHTVRNHKLPTIWDEHKADWIAGGIQIRPLRLILEIFLALHREIAAREAYLTGNELRRVVVPLSIVTVNATELAGAVFAFREDSSSFQKLPDCAPNSNDVRMLHEHLLFLQGFGWLGRLHHKSRNEAKFFIEPEALTLITKTLKLTSAEVPSIDEEHALIGAEVFVPDNKSRGSVIGTRPVRDPRFKKYVFAHFRGKCLVTQESLKQVLIACHIHEVRDNGSDASSNGIVLRSDLHILFDNNKLRISENGDVVVSPDVASALSYSALPKKVTLPREVDRELLRRRFLYGRVIRQGG